MSGKDGGPPKVPPQDLPEARGLERAEGQVEEPSESPEDSPEQPSQPQIQHASLVDAPDPAGVSTEPVASAQPPPEGSQDPAEESQESPSEKFSRVDALFAGEPPPPPALAGPRIRRLQLILMVAIPLDVLGVPCWTGVPGAALTLWAWLLADSEVARVEAGEYTTDDAARLMRLRTISAWALGFCVVSLLVQTWLLSTAFYNRFYDRLWDMVGRLFG